MRSVKIRIPGSFWDSQIYSGELLLLGDGGELHRVDWGAFIDRVALENLAMQTAIRVAFSDSDLFYNPKVRKILRDPHVEAPIKSQLFSLADFPLEAAERLQSKDYWSTSDSPFDFLPTDTEVYYNQFFAGGEEGLFSFPRTATGKYKKSELQKHHDASVFQVKASDRFSALATAAGVDGLFDFNVPRFTSQSAGKILGDGRQLATNACNACDWAFQSVMGWSQDHGFMASFREERDPGSNKKFRVFDRVIDQEEIFGESESSRPESFWGSREKIYKISDGVISVLNYAGTKGFAGSNAKFEKKGEQVLHINEEPIATGTAPFGTVLEMSDKIIVLRSDGEIETFPGEPAHWRVFPRSEHYSNQLHIVYSDYVDIISFTHDYFVEQSSKMFGFTKGSD